MQPGFARHRIVPENGGARVRIAKVDDARIIRSISIASNVTRDSGAKTGFVEYETPGEDGYVERIKDNPFFYVAESEKGVVGFLSCFADTTIHKLGLDRDEIAMHVSKKPIPFIYADQLAVIDIFWKRGVAVGSLMSAFLGDASAAGYREVWAAVSHSPIRNLAARNLCANFGFRCHEEIHAYKGLVFGIYKKEI